MKISLNEYESYQEECILKEKMELADAKKEIAKVNVNYECLDKDIDRVAIDKRRENVNTFLSQLFNTLDIPEV